MASFTRSARFVATAAFLLAGTVLADAKVLATVNGTDITDEDVKIATQDLGPTLPQQLKGEQRDSYVLDYLIDLKLAAAQGGKDGIADTPDFKRQMDYYREKTLMEGLLSKIAKTAATPEAEKKVYDDVAAKQKPEDEYRARHILVPTEEEAKAALARVKKGEDFAKVADDVSKDPGSQGGELGWFTKDKMVPEFADATAKLERGQISDPVKSQFGWHVIQLEDKRQKTFPPFDQVKDQVARYVIQKAQSDEIMKLRDAAKITRNDQPATPDAGAAPGGAAPAGTAPAGTAPAGTEAPATPDAPATPAPDAAAPKP